MIKTKYQPGDNVRVRADLKENQSYSMLSGGSQIVVTPMTAFAGKTVTIVGVSKNGYTIKEDIFTWTDKMFEPTQPIVIYHKNNKVIALDKNTGTKGIAKCSPDDTFDFYVGAELAFKRLMEHEQQEQQKEAEPKFKVGDIVVGLPEAGERYNVTRAGWKGIVAGVNINDAGMISAIGVDSKGVTHTYTVHPDYFRKIEDKEGNNDEKRIHEEKK